MKYIKYIVVLFFSFLLFFAFNVTVKASSFCAADPVSGNWALCNIDTFDPENSSCISTGEGGSQEAYECCLSAGTSTCEPPTSGGVGSGQNCVPPVNCPFGWDPAFNQPPKKVRSCDQSDPKICGPKGSAQQIIGCCGAGIGEGDEWVCGSPQYATYPCCPPGTSDQCVVNDTGNTYTKRVNQENRNSCGDSEGVDVFISNQKTNVVQAEIKICDDPDHEGCYIYHKYKYDVTCQDFVKTCSCTPTCDATAPSEPSLISPANGGSVSTEIVSLVWNDSTQDWGTSCVTDSNSYEIYIGTSPSSLALLGIVYDGSGNSVPFGSGVTGQTYYWKVRAKNGSAQTDSSVWQFNLSQTV